jgi:predicted dehydrogenase
MPSVRTTEKRVRYAVVGAGWFGQEAVLPAFANAKENSELAAIVSGDTEKRAVLAADYNVPAYSLEQYEDLLASGSVDAVYLVSPNAVHKDQTLLAAKHGIHVLCEKPLADTAVAAEAMIAACDKAGVLLMTAYRLHFEPANLQAIDLIRKQAIGEPRLFTATITQNVRSGASRLDPEFGGGPLSDIGIYPINAARYLFRAEPVEVTAFQAAGDDPKFKVVPESYCAVMRFPGDRLATFTCGFGQSSVSAYHVLGTKGHLKMDPGFAFSGERRLYLTTDAAPEVTTFPDADQVAPEIVYFSGCIKAGRRPEPDGREGLIDLWIIEAIKASALKGMAVPLQPVPEKPRPQPTQEITKPAREKPELVNAAPPTA